MAQITSPAETTEGNQGRRGRLLVLNLGHGAVHYFMLIYPTAVLTMGNEFAAGYDRLLSLATVGFFTLGLATLPAGWLGDRFSRRGLIVAFFLGVGLSAILTGLAARPWQIAAGLGAIGLFGSIFHPVGMALLVQETDGAGQALGVFGVSGNLGLALAALVTGGLCQWWGWRTAFFLPGGLSILLGLVYAAQVARAGPLPELRKKTVSVPSEGGDAVVSARRHAIRIFAVVVAMAMFGGFIFNATTVALPKVFAERLTGLATSTVAVGGWVSIIFALAAVAQILIGRRLDRGQARGALMAVAAGQALFLLLSVPARDSLLLLTAGPMMFAIFGQIPIGDWLIARHAVGRWHARIYAVKYVLGLGVSATAVPAVAWLHGEYAGFSQMFLILSGLACLTLLAATTLPNQHISQKKQGSG